MCLVFTVFNRFYITGVVRLVVQLHGLMTSATYLLRTLLDSLGSTLPIKLDQIDHLLNAIGK